MGVPKYAEYQEITRGEEEQKGGGSLVCMIYMLSGASRRHRVSEVKGSQENLTEGTKTSRSMS